MKRSVLFGAICAAFGLSAGSASAAGIDSATMAGLAATNVFVISGATAPQNTLIDTIQTNICGGSFTRLRSASGASARYQAWGCQLNGTGANIAIYYTTLGSNWGVQPVIQNRQVPRLNVNATGCTAAAGGVNEACGNSAITPVAPDLGVSDIRPSGFVASNFPTDFATIAAEFPETNVAPYNATTGSAYAALTSPYSSGGQIDPVQGVVFGIAISNTLTNLLQTAQSLPPTNNVRDSRAPSLDTKVVSALLSGGLNGNQLDAALGITTTTSPRYVVCRRVPTSGTFSWANVYWLRNGSFPDVNATVPTAPSTSWELNTVPATDVAYVANTTGGNVRACMNRANALGIAAFGTLSLENDNNAGAAPGTPAVANTWSFAKLDGVPVEDTTLPTPTQASNLNRVKDGSYDYVGEVTLNRRANFSGTKLTVYNSLRDNLRGATVCTISGAPATGAVQMAGVGSDTTCKTNWSRDADPFTTPKRKP